MKCKKHKHTHNVDFSLLLKHCRQCRLFLWRVIIIQHIYIGEYVSEVVKLLWCEQMTMLSYDDKDSRHECDGIFFYFKNLFDVLFTLTVQNERHKESEIEKNPSY